MATTALTDPILTLYRNRKSQVQSFYSGLFRQMARRYDLFRGIYRSVHSATRNQIHIPFLLNIVESNLARKIQALFSQYPYVDFRGTDPMICRKNAELTAVQADETDMVLKAIDFMTSADVYGKGYWWYGWKTVMRRMKWRAPNEFGGMSIQSEDVVSFDGPDIRVLDILDTWVQPGRKLRNALWVMVRDRATLHELEGDAKRGLYSKAAIRLLKSTGNAPSEVEEESAWRWNLYRSQTAYEAQKTETAMPHVQIIHMIGVVPDEFATDGVNFRIVTVADDRVVLRNDPFDLWHGKIPIVGHSPIEDPHYEHGIGKIEAVEKIAYLANRFQSQKADILDWTMDPQYVVSDTAGLDDENLFTRSGRLINVSGPADESTIRALSPDLRGLALAGQEVPILWRYIQQGTGESEDTTLGMGSPRGTREPARSYLSRQEQALTRKALEMLKAEREVIEPTFDGFRGLNTQFLPIGKEIEMIGQKAIVDPKTGMAIQLGKQIIGPEDLRGDYRARARAGTRMLTKTQQQANLYQLLPLLAQNPAASVVQWVTMLRHTLEVYDFPNVDEFLVQNRPPVVDAAAEATNQSPEDVIQAAQGMDLAALAQLPPVEG